MKTPRAALIAAFLAAASSAHAAKTVSLDGWTQFKANFIANEELLTISGVAYTDGKIYCDLRPKKPSYMETAAERLAPSYDCVVIGKAQASVGPKVGGLFASGQAVTKWGKGPKLTAPGSRDYGSLVLRIVQVTKDDKLVVLASEGNQNLTYTSYMEGGVPLSGNPEPPSIGQGSVQHYWCNPKTGAITHSTAKKALKGSRLIAGPKSPCVKDPTAVVESPVVATPVAVVADSLELIKDVETRWLTKVQAAAYADKRSKAADAGAKKTADEGARALVKAQIRPEAASAYETASKDAAAATKIPEAIGKVEMWGGDGVAAIVAPFQEKADAKLLEIQLSKADWTTLKKKENADKLAAYTASRLGANGSNVPDGGGAAAFDKKYYDPVALHLGVEAARKAIGATAPAAGTKPDAVAAAPLTEAELKLLTPAERQAYDKLLDNAKKKQPGSAEALAAESARLRKLIADEKRGADTAYVPPKTLEDFNKLPKWQQRAFCDPKAGGAAILEAGPTSSDAQLNAPGSAKVALTAAEKKLRDERLAAQQKAAAAANAPLPDWARGPCAQLLANVNPGPSGGTGGDTGGSGIGNLTNDNKEPDAKDKSMFAGPYFTKPLVFAGVKGALIGLVIGSLFGPVGLVAGPLIGAALFYGIAKYDASKAKSDE